MDDEIKVAMMIIMNSFITITSVIHPDFYEHDDEIVNILAIFNLMTLIITRCNPSSTDLTLFERLFTPSQEGSVWGGRDVFSLFSHRRQEFWLVTETPETFQQMVMKINSSLFSDRRRRNYTLSPKNRVLMTLIWLRQYPTYAIWSLLFDIDISSVGRIVEHTWMVLWEEYAPNVKWNSLYEWQQCRGKWPEMPNVVGAIDGTSHEILVPQENQQLYYSGHRKFHCIHTQVIIDNMKNIVYIHSGFLGHENDAATFRQLPQIGPGLDLDFPPNCRFLADSIYPNAYPIISPYKSISIRNQNQQEQRRRRKFNRKLRSRRVYVEHMMKELHVKTYRVIAGIYRHQRNLLSSVVELCAGLAQRKLKFIEQL